MKIILYLFCGFFISISCYGQNQDVSDQQKLIKTESTKLPINPKHQAKLDKYARSTSFQDERDILTLASYLVKPAKNDAEKIRVIFSWLAFHIDYDARGLNTGKYGDLSAEGVLKSRRAVCEGFSNLFQALCDAAGIEAKRISGYAKGYGYSPNQKLLETNHTWNAVKIDGNWYFMDATWGQGYGVSKNGRLIAHQEFDDYWFAPDPKEFIFTHLPENPAWQLFPDPLSKLQFEQLPYIDPLLFHYGFDQDSIYTRVMEDKKFRFVSVYSTDYPMEILSSPLNQEIQGGEVFTCKIRSKDAIEIAAINNNNWTTFRKKGDLFELTIRPESGELSIGARFNKRDKSYQTILQYQVVKSY